MELTTILAILLFVISIVLIVLVLISDGDLSLMFLDKFANKLGKTCHLFSVDFCSKMKRIKFPPIINSFDNHFMQNDTLDLIILVV